MASVLHETPESENELPPSASAFFQHFGARSSSSSSSSAASSLQHTLSLQATNSTHQASMRRARDSKKTDGGMTLARLTAVSAPRAWTWKTVLPTSAALELTDSQYRFATRLNLGLQPVEGTAALPATCPICNKVNSIRNDPLHFMSCQRLDSEQIRARHDDVARAIHRCALLMGLRAQLEPTHLQCSTKRGPPLRPDLLLSLPGRHILSDVAVCHPLAAGAVSDGIGLRTLGTARHKETVKRAKYTEIALQHRFEQLPFVLETTGGMGPSAVLLVKAMAEASEEHLAVWTREQVVRELLGSVAVAVQRGGLWTYRNGYDRVLRMMSAAETEQEDEEDEKQGKRWGDEEWTGEAIPVCAV